MSYENVTTIVTAELAYTTDIETFKVRMEGMDQPTQWSNRVTHVLPARGRRVAARCTATPIAWRSSTSRRRG